MTCTIRFLAYDIYVVSSIISNDHFDRLLCLLKLRAKRSLLKSIQKLSDYQFLNVVHKGDMSAVYLAKRIESDTNYAIKVINKNDVKAAKIELKVKKEIQIMERANK